ncbi:MAG: hypothetical protein QNK37_07175 [Acidobacteriota bacterium]|nr:hypothetical protein [Acidobacteriota bacterium]
MKYALLILLSLCLPAFAQTDVDRLLDANIFDPDRGKKPAEETEENDAPETQVVSKDLPVLDGTLIVGDVRIALFTILEDGKPKGVRAYVNDQVGAYKVKSIDREKVELMSGARPVPVSLYSGNKQKRGGTKQVAKVTKKPTPARRANTKDGPKRGLKPGDKNKPKPLPNARDNKNKKNNRFQKRTPPTRKTNTRGNKLEKKF